MKESLLKSLFFELSDAVNCMQMLLMSARAVVAFTLTHPDPHSEPDISHLEGIVALFTNKDAVFAGWLHYCVFDPMVGLGEVLDSLLHCNMQVVCFLHFQRAVLCEQEILEYQELCKCLLSF